LSYLDQTVQRLSAIRSTIEHALAGEFPYDEPRIALDHLLEWASDNLKDLEEARDRSAHDRERTCARVDIGIRDVSQLVGYLIRATNVRNSFEWVWPFQELCEKLFGNTKKKVVLSSEWNFIPFITTVAPYSTIPALAQFAFIGLPAAAHEIGHSFWQAGGYPKNIGAEIKKAIRKVRAEMPFNGDEGRAAEDAAKQVQELFCDLIGVGLFGSGYLFTFAYLCPSPGVKIGRNLLRDPDYPSNQTRAIQHVKFSELSQVRVPEGYLDRYDDPRIGGVCRRGGAADEGYVAFVDAVVIVLSEALRRHVFNLLAEKNVLRGERAREVDRIRQAFAARHPFGTPDSVADIVEAGWRVKYENDGISDEDLSNLVLKTIEIYEYIKLEAA
jgi:hypothetical protein